MAANVALFSCRVQRPPRDGVNAARPLFCCELVSNELRENISALYPKSKCNTLRSGAVIRIRIFFKETGLDNIGRPCVKDASRLFEWILEARRLSRTISHHLPMRSAASARLDSSNPGACRPDHVYFRPPWSTALPQKHAILPQREEAGGNGPAEMRMVRPWAKRVKGAETCPLFFSAGYPLLCSHCGRLRGAERLW